LSEADAERAQVQHGIQHAREDGAPPDAPVDRHPVLVGAKRVRHQSISVRPVRRRKTSSRVERRTSTLWGWRRSWAAGTSASPSSVYRSRDRKSTRLNSSHRTISYAVFCLKKKKNKK